MGQNDEIKLNESRTMIINAILVRLQGKQDTKTYLRVPPYTLLILRIWLPKPQRPCVWPTEIRQLPTSGPVPKSLTFSYPPGKACIPSAAC